MQGTPRAPPRTALPTVLSARAMLRRERPAETGGAARRSRIVTSTSRCADLPQRRARNAVRTPRGALAPGARRGACRCLTASAVAVESFRRGNERSRNSRDSLRKLGSRPSIAHGLVLDGIAVRDAQVLVAARRGCGRLAPRPRCTAGRAAGKHLPPCLGARGSLMAARNELLDEIQVVNIIDRARGEDRVGEACRPAIHGSRPAPVPTSERSDISETRRASSANRSTLSSQRDSSAASRRRSLNSSDCSIEVVAQGAEALDACRLIIWHSAESSLRLPQNRGNRNHANESGPSLPLMEPGCDGTPLKRVPWSMGTHVRQLFAFQGRLRAPVVGGRPPGRVSPRARKPCGSADRPLGERRPARPDRLAPVPESGSRGVQP